MRATVHFFAAIIYLGVMSGRHLRAQESHLQFEQLTIEHGLPSNMVNAIIQDSQGFLWFGTRDGLARYDGSSFKVYKHDPSDSTSISNNWIRTLYEDASHTLWIGTNRGFSKFDRFTEKFTQFLPNTGDSTRISGSIVWTIFEDRSGTLWIGSWAGPVLPLGGLYKFDRQSGRLTRFQHEPNNPNSLSNNAVRCIVEDDSGSLWIGTQQHGLNRFDPATETFTRYLHDPENPNSISSNAVWGAMKARDGSLWFSTFGGGVTKYDPEIDGFIQYKHDPHDLNSLNSDKIGPIFQDFSGMFWISNGVLSRFDPQTDTFTHFQFSPEQKEWHSNYMPFDIYEDASHNLWVGTRSSGVFKIDLKPQKFTHYTYNPENPNSLSSDEISIIYEDSRGVLWIATRLNGLNRFDPEIEQFTRFQRQPADPQSLSRDMVTAIYEDRSGILWIGTHAGLNKLNPDGSSFTRYLDDSDNPWMPNEGWVNTIFEDSANRFWIGTNGSGLKRFDRQRERFYTFNPDPKGNKFNRGNDIVTIYEDRHENFWVAAFPEQYHFDRYTNRFTPLKAPESRDDGWGFLFFEDRNGTLWGASNGLVKLDRGQKQFVRYRFRPNLNHEAGFDRAYNHLYCIYEDSTGMLWCGTQSNGLLKFDPQKSAFVGHYLEKDGLLSSVVYKILADSHGNLWLLTPVGISIFDENQPPGKQFKNIGFHDGIVNSATLNTRAAFLKTKNGEIYWGGTNGIYRFYPEVKITNLNIPPVRLTEFKIFNEIAELDMAISEIRTVHLEHDQNFFSLSFAALDFTNPQQNQYAYKLDGFDEDWIQSGNKHEASYTNVPPGTYTFRVKGSNNDRIWNEEGASVQIVVQPPYWAMWWFRALIIVVVIGFLALLYNYRVARLLEIERTRTRIAHDLHDEVGSSLSSIVLESELVRNKAALGEDEERHLKHIGKTSRKIIEALDDIVWAINPQYDKLDDLLLRMKDFAAELLSQQALAYTFDFPRQEFPQALKMAFRRNLFLIYKELLHNIIKHSQARCVEMKLAKSDHMLTLKVVDDGIGFDPENENHGNGLQSMKKRAAELGGEIEFKSQANQGTEVTLTVKIP